MSSPALSTKGFWTIKNIFDWFTRKYRLFLSKYENGINCRRSNYSSFYCSTSLTLDSSPLYPFYTHKCINHAVGSVDPRSLSHIKIFQLLINHDVTTYQNTNQTDKRDAVASMKPVLSHVCKTFLENKYNLDLNVWRIHFSLLAGRK